MDSDYFGAVRVHFNPAFEGDFFSDLALSVERSTRSVSPGQTFGCVTNGQLGLTLINRGNLGYYRNPDQGAGLSLILASGDREYRYGPYPLTFLRLWNSSLATMTARVTCGFDLRAAAITDIFGGNAEPLKRSESDFEVLFCPFEFKTVLLTEGRAMK